jgi:hypothetical protein
LFFSWFFFQNIILCLIIRCLYIWFDLIHELFAMLGGD